MSVSRETPLLPEAVVSRETLAKLMVFQTLLCKWSEAINLVGRRDRELLWPRHIKDSLQLCPLIAGAQCPGIDLGSGAGFPGLIVAIATNHPFSLIEADHRKAAFLREVKRAVDAPVEVFCGRIESVNFQQTDLVTARGLASVSDLLALAEPLLRPDGRCIFLKGRKGQHELTVARRRWHMKVRQWQSRTHPDGRIVELSEIAIAEPVGEPAAK